MIDTRSALKTALLRAFVSLVMVMVAGALAFAVVALVGLRVPDMRTLFGMLCGWFVGFFTASLPWGRR